MGPGRRLGRTLLTIVLLGVLAASTTGIVSDYVVSNYSTACPSGATPFTSSQTPPLTVFQLVPPGVGIVCITLRLSGLTSQMTRLSPAWMIHQSTLDSMSAESCNSGDVSNCGMSVYSTPGQVHSLPFQIIHLTLRIEAPTGAREGAYWALFFQCRGNQLLLVNIGKNISKDAGILPPAPHCPPFNPQSQFWNVHPVSFTWDSYMGLTPLFTIRNG